MKTLLLLIALAWACSAPIGAQTVGGPLLLTEPVRWESQDNGSTTPFSESDGTLTFNSPATDSSMKSQQSLFGDFKLEFSADPDNTQLPNAIGIENVIDIGQGGSDSFFFARQPFLNNDSFTIDSSDLALGDDATYPNKFTLERVGNIVRVYKNSANGNPPAILISRKVYLAVYKITLSVSDGLAGGTRVVYQPMLTIPQNTREIETGGIWRRH